MVGDQFTRCLIVKLRKDERRIGEQNTVQSANAQKEIDSKSKSTLSTSLLEKTTSS